MVFSLNLSAKSFSEIVKLIDTHDLVQSKLSLAKSAKEGATVQSSWGDPEVSVSALNFPRESLDHNESMMTGYQFGLSQKISFSGKYSQLESAGLEHSKAMQSDAKQMKRSVGRFIWEVAIEKERLSKEEVILKENLTWISNMLKISKRLYETGKAPQQAVLDVHIRKSELKASLDKINFTQRSLDLKLSEALSSNDKITIDLNTVPWGHLDNLEKSKSDFDFQERKLKHELQASNHKVSAKNRNYIPDIKLGVSYTKRNDIDGIGDFVGASVGFSIPIGSSKYAEKSAAVFDKAASEYNYKNYLKTKETELSRILIEIENLENELKILNSETLKFAKSSRDVAAKSYSTGTTEYVELLRSELQYQNQLLKRVKVISMLKNKKVSYLFLKGDDLKVEGMR